MTTIFFAQVPAYVPTSGLTGWFPFTGNAIDLSGSGNNGTALSPVLASDRFSNTNSAYSFDGVDDYIDLGSSPSLYFSSGLSVSAWINANTLGSMKIIEKCQNSPYFLIYQFFIEPTGQVGVGLRVDAGSSAYTISTETITTGQWHHVVFSWQKTINGGLCKIFINGQEATYSTQTPLTTDIAVLGSESTKIGADLYPALEPVDGKLDDIGLWDRALTACEVTDLYQSQLNSLTVGAGTDLAVCPTQSVTLAGTGASTYSWDNGAIDGASFVPSAGSMTYTVTGTDGAGCTGQDQIVVTANVNSSSSISPISCDSFTAPDGQVYSASGNYIAVIQNALGCDSTITIDLTVNYSNTGIDVIQACDSYTWIDGNNYMSSNNTATYTLSNQSGCDSLVTLNLTLNNSSTSTLNESGMDSYTLNGQTYNQSGTYTQTIPNEQGCDSTITLNLSLQFTGIEESTLNSFKVYPNPSSDFVTIESQDQGTVELCNLLGEVLQTIEITETQTILNLSTYPAGIYLIRHNEVSIKFIKK
jgi:hypothetical protein